VGATKLITPWFRALENVIDAELMKIFLILMEP
jgi:hypothetical protein